MKMNKTAIFLAMALILPMGVAQASELDDVTMQVLESNEPAEVTSDISLPEVDNSVNQQQEQDDVSSNSNDVNDDSSSEAQQSADDSRSEIESEMENEVEDSSQEAEDSRQEVEDSAQEVEQSSVDSATDN